MQIVEGSVVRATAGRDKGGFLRSSDSMARARYFQTAGAVSSKRPKKKLIHLAPTATVIPASSLKTNRQIREALHPFNFGGEEL